jgi:hypothetical protein
MRRAMDGLKKEPLSDMTKDMTELAIADPELGAIMFDHVVLQVGRCRLTLWIPS